jgi:hypothetical protein
MTARSAGAKSMATPLSTAFEALNSLLMTW